MAASAAQASTYRAWGPGVRATPLRATAYRTAISTPCQRKWTRVHPRRSTHGCDERNCMAFTDSVEINSPSASPHDR
jgi:hypothetical protein